MIFRLFSVLLFLFTCAHATEPVVPGIERISEQPYLRLLQGKRVGLITNHTAVTRDLRSSIDVLKELSGKKLFKLTTLYSPEHGLNGEAHAGEKVCDHEHCDGLPVYSLHGAHRRPNDAMLRHVDILVFDIQDIGSRSYTYISTLFYVMEEAAKRRISVVVTDRPNPLGGTIIDGPMMEERFRSFLGYVDVPYVHGMTVGELAHFFNTKYRVGCDLHVVPMAGWRRSMTFAETGLPWIPTSPNIPESDSPFFYPTTGLLGELGLVNIGIGYTLPFKVVGAPWIDADHFADHLNRQNFAGVHFQPYHFKPYHGRYAKKPCQGVLIMVTDPTKFKPYSTQYLLIGILKSLYPTQFSQAMQKLSGREELLAKINGTEKVFNTMRQERYIVWKLKEIDKEKRINFITERNSFLIQSYKA